MSQQPSSNTNVQDATSISSIPSNLPSSNDIHHKGGIKESTSSTTTPDQIIIDTLKVSAVSKRKSPSSTLKTNKYKSTKKANPTTYNLEFAPVAKNLQIGSIYTLFMCGFTAVVMKPTDPVWASRIPGAYCLFISILLYVWCFFSEFNRETKESVENILNPIYWPERVCSILSVMNRNEFQCAFCFVLSIYTFFCVQTAIAGFNLIFASIFFLVASIRREKPIRITGLV